MRSFLSIGDESSCLSLDMDEIELKVDCGRMAPLAHEVER